MVTFVLKYCGKRRRCCLPAFSPFPTMFSKSSVSGSLKGGIVWERVYHTIPTFNSLPDMPILGFSNSAPNKDTMSKI